MLKDHARCLALQDSTNQDSIRAKITASDPPHGNPFDLCISPPNHGLFERTSGAGVAASSLTLYVSPECGESTLRAPRRVRGSVLRTAIFPPPLAASVSPHDRHHHVFSAHSHTPYPVPHVDQPLADDAALACHMINDRKSRGGVTPNN